MRAFKNALYYGGQLEWLETEKKVFASEVRKFFGWKKNVRVIANDTIYFTIEVPKRHPIAKNQQKNLAAKQVQRLVAYTAEAHEAVRDCLKDAKGKVQQTPITKKKVVFLCEDERFMFPFGYEPEDPFLPGYVERQEIVRDIFANALGWPRHKISWHGASGIMELHF